MTKNITLEHRRCWWLHVWLYVFCMSKKGIVIAHPTGVGIDAMANKDSDGNVVGQLVLENTKNNEINTIKYKLTRMSLGEEKNIQNFQ